MEQRPLSPPPIRTKNALKLGMPGLQKNATKGVFGHNQIKPGPKMIEGYQRMDSYTKGTSQDPNVKDVKYFETIGIHPHTQQVRAKFADNEQWYTVPVRPNMISENWSIGTPFHTGKNIKSPIRIEPKYDLEDHFDYFHFTPASPVQHSPPVKHAKSPPRHAKSAPKHAKSAPVVARQEARSRSPRHSRIKRQADTDIDSDIDSNPDDDGKQSGDDSFINDASSSRLSKGPASLLDKENGASVDDSSDDSFRYDGDSDDKEFLRNDFSDDEEFLRNNFSPLATGNKATKQRPGKLRLFNDPYTAHRYKMWLQQRNATQWFKERDRHEKATEFGVTDADRERIMRENGRDRMYAIQKIKDYAKEYDNPKNHQAEDLSAIDDSLIDLKKNYIYPGMVEQENLLKQTLERNHRDRALSDIEKYQDEASSFIEHYSEKIGDVQRKIKEKSSEAVISKDVKKLHKLRDRLQSEMDLIIVPTDLANRRIAEELLAHGATGKAVRSRSSGTRHP